MEVFHLRDILGTGMPSHRRMTYGLEKRKLISFIDMTYCDISAFRISPRILSDDRVRPKAGDTNLAE